MKTISKPLHRMCRSFWGKEGGRVEYLVDFFMMARLGVQSLWILTFSLFSRLRAGGAPRYNSTCFNHKNIMLYFFSCLKERPVACYDFLIRDCRYVFTWTLRIIINFSILSMFDSVESSILPDQHDFMPGFTAVTNPALIRQCVSECFNERRQVDVVFTDISHVFDKITHEILLY